MLVGREPAKMRPSKDLTTCGRWVRVRPGWSSVMAGRPLLLSTGRPGCPGIPGTPGDPSRRAGSQGAAQQETLPLIAHAVHVGGLLRDERHTRYDRRSAVRRSTGPFVAVMMPGSGP